MTAPSHAPSSVACSSAEIAEGAEAIEEADGGEIWLGAWTECNLTEVLRTARVTVRRRGTQSAQLRSRELSPCRW